MIPPADPLTALIAQWRGEAHAACLRFTGYDMCSKCGFTEWAHAARKHADQLESLLGSLRGREGPHEPDTHGDQHARDR